MTYFGKLRLAGRRVQPTLGGRDAALHFGQGRIAHGGQCIVGSETVAGKEVHELCRTRPEFVLKDHVVLRITEGVAIMASNIRSLTLDVLKPHEPSIVEVADRLAALAGVACVHITVLEVDANTETVKVALVGEAIDFHAIRTELEATGATVHSIDHVSAGRYPLPDESTMEHRA